jgi:chorismate lyase/3-hydroxybenzoate synthase
MDVNSMLSLPPWVEWIVAANKCSGALERRRTPENCRLISIRCADASRLSDDVFIETARVVYGLLRSKAEQLGAPWPVRIWNFIPGIHAGSRDGDRYMSFNVGRYEGLADWFGDSLIENVPAATGVGHDGSDLNVHALVADCRPINVENPHQVPAYRYSDRYGRMPPCFARATRMGEWLFVSGTAAVAGEESRYPDQFDLQLDLALANLQSVAQHGAGARATFEHVRVYLPPAAGGIEGARISEKLIRQLPMAAGGNEAIEYIHADLCRQELLVEIEALVRAEGKDAR